MVYQQAIEYVRWVLSSMLAGILYAGVTRQPKVGALLSPAKRGDYWRKRDDPFAAAQMLAIGAQG